MACVAAVHHPLGDIDPPAGDITIGVDVRDAVHRPGMNAHAKLDVGMFTKTVVQFYGAANGSFGIVEENQRHPVAGWQADESILSLRLGKFGCLSNHLLQLAQDALLLVHGQSRVGHYVHKEDVCHLQAVSRAGVVSGQGLTPRAILTKPLLAKKYPVAGTRAHLRLCSKASQRTQLLGNRFGTARETRNQRGRITVANRDYHELSHSEIGGAKRIYQHLSGSIRLSSNLPSTSRATVVSRIPSCFFQDRDAGRLSLHNAKKS
jgi:hypothetical protein